MPAPPFHPSLSTVIVQLWNHGVLVVAACDRGADVVFLGPNGVTAQVPRVLLDQPPALAVAVLRPLLPTGDVRQLDGHAPIIEPRTLAWWQFLRWWRDRERVQAAREAFAAR